MASTPPPSLPPLSPSLLAVISQAQVIAARAGEPVIIEAFDLLLAMAVEPSGQASKVLRSLDVTQEKLLKNQTWYPPTAPPNHRGMAASAQRVLQIAESLAVAENAPSINTKHLLLSVTQDLQCASVLRSLDIEPADISKALQVARSPRSRRSSQLESELDKWLTPYAVDLTELASRGQLDPVIGREVAISRIIEVMCRRSKNNPVIIGPAGCGKTAIVEGVAQRIADQAVPLDLLEKRILALDMAALVAGTKYRGEFQERIKNLLTVLEQNPQIVIFIDEIAATMGIGDSGGGQNASNLLKPALARGQISFIGATTDTEYRQLENQDPALARRLQKVDLPPLSRDEVIAILNGLRPTYETFHNLQIPPASIAAAADWSKRYGTNRVWPDSAIDLIDEGSAVSAIAQKRHPELPRILTPENIATVVSGQTGIPTAELLHDDAARLLHFEQEIGTRVIGQAPAVKAVGSALRRSRSGLRDPRRPIASLLFIGPTGVGKTQLARSVAKFMFGNEDSLLTLDMSEFAEEQSLSRLIGAPAGYVGYEESGQLTKALQYRPYSVVLFDEIEKAHPTVRNLLLQILDDGRFTDGHGRHIDTSNCVIVATSNVGSGNQPKPIGWLSSDNSLATPSPTWQKAAVTEFSPELLNRFDAIVPFHSLSVSQCAQIANIYASEYAERIKREHAIDITFDEASLEALSRRHVSPEYGAREIRRGVANEIINPLADYLLEHQPPPGSTLTWRADGISATTIDDFEPLII